ncbi:MAG: flavin reductase [Bacteroidota bacterium]|nr:MAG: flavin reductase [Bacteroidota bacterium]
MKNIQELFRSIKPEEIQSNIFSLIGKEWFLITAGTEKEFNTMTASWGMAGILWNKPIFVSYVRPTRHTYLFMQEADIFTISFIGENREAIHKICGSKSGRDTNKIKESGLRPVLTERGNISFEQANLVLECRKIYFDDLKPVYFLPDDIDEVFYPNQDYHRVYYGEILNVYTR